MLHAIERMGMRAVQVPTHASEGIDLGALSEVLQRQDVAACMVMTNFQNPLGFIMPDEKKEALVQLLTGRDLSAQFYQALRVTVGTPAQNEQLLEAWR